MLHLTHLAWLYGHWAFMPSLFGCGLGPAGVSLAVVSGARQPGVTCAAGPRGGCPTAKVEGHYAWQIIYPQARALARRQCSALSGFHRLLQSMHGRTKAQASTHRLTMDLQRAQSLQQEHERTSKPSRCFWLPVNLSGTEDLDTWPEALHGFPFDYPTTMSRFSQSTSLNTCYTQTFRLTAHNRSGATMNHLPFCFWRKPYRMSKQMMTEKRIEACMCIKCSTGGRRCQP